MRCPKCGKDVELQNKQVGVDENGKPIFNKYAICKDCKKQWNLDKQKDKKAANANASNHIQSKESTPAKAKPAAEKDGTPKPMRANPATTAANRPSPKKEPVNKEPVKKLPVKKAPTEEEPSTENVVKKVPPKKRPASPESKPAAPSQKPASPSAKAPAPAKRTPSASAKANVSDSDAVPVKRAVPSGKPAASKRDSAESKTGTSGRPVRKPAQASPSGQKPAGQRPAPRNRPAAGDTGRRRPVTADEEQKYGNIPPEKVRVKRERAVKDSYEDMLATDPNRKPMNKKKAVPAEDTPKKKAAAASQVKRRPEPIVNDTLEKEEPDPKFRALRIVFGVISILAFAFFAYKGFMAGLNNISSGKNATTGTTYIVLALCMLVAGLLLLIMQKKRTIFSFVLPMIFYLACAAFAFFKRADDKFLLYGAIAGAVLAVIFLVLTIASRSGDDDYGYDDEYDDPFEEDHDNY